MNKYQTILQEKGIKNIETFVSRVIIHFTDGTSLEIISVDTDIDLETKIYYWDKSRKCQTLERYGK